MHRTSPRPARCSRPYDPKVLTLADQSQFMFPKDADDARRFVRVHKAFGSAAVKFWFIETREHPAAEFEPIVMAAGDEASAQGLPLIVHATTLATARIAVAAGARLLVHSVENTEVDDAFVAAAKEKGTFYCPTLTVRAGYQQLAAAKIGDEVRSQLDDVHPSVKARVLRTEDEEFRKKVNQRAIEGMNQRMGVQQQVMAKNIMKLRAAGVPIVMGTDAGNPLTLHGPSVFVEMEAMQAGGHDGAAGRRRVDARRRGRDGARQGSRSHRGRLRRGPDRADAGSGVRRARVPFARAGLPRRSPARAFGAAAALI
jgi:imidazolonepropionase-like amidohydrolase